MDSTCIENSCTNRFNEMNNLTFGFQKIFSDLNKNSITNSELPYLKESIVNILLKENLKQQEIEIAFKIYYKTLQKLNITTDNVFFANFNERSLHYQSIILHTMLFTNFQTHYRECQIKELCKTVYLKSVEENSKYLITILKALNLFLKRYPDTIFEIKLVDIYFCLQSNNGSKIRDETLQLFDNCLQKSPIFAYETFSIVLNNIPWTNKNKFYLLSTILNTYSLESCKNMVEFKNDEFFEGIRLSLTFKHLFSAGQYLIKSLNTSNNDSFLELLLRIFESGTEKELINLNSQWWRYIKKKESLYFKISIQEIFQNIQSRERSFKYFLICYLFRNNISKLHENIFSKILYYFIKNFKNWDSHVQLFIYKYVIESLPIANVYNEKINDKIYTVQDILIFFVEFFKINLFNCFPEFRQVILEKIPEIINFISKQLSRNIEDLLEKENNLKSIETFFVGINDIYKHGISLTDYQPVIFAVKLIHLIILLIYSKSTKNISKNYTLKNEKLSQFLNEKNIFDFQEIQINLLQLLNSESCEYDDVQLVIINTIKFIKYEAPDVLKILEECKKKCRDSDYDKCCTASLFASIIIDCDQNQTLNIKNNLYKFCFENITYCFQNFENDPFFMCKSGYHLFGFIGCLNQIYLTDTYKEYNLQQYEKIVNTCFLINNTILKLLRLSSENINENTSASFEIMDESLEILLQKSKSISQNHFTDRKFLLLSFWTTLKETCYIATTIGINLIKYSKENENLKLQLFEKCLDININVLQKCRHKGAIEAAGVSLGNLVKRTTTTSDSKSKFYKILFKCFDVLFGNVSQNSLTRRGAGLSIMFHHLLKNDMDNSKLLFYYAIKTLMLHVQKSETPKEKIILKTTDNGENFDALILHYLCVLVKDTELKGYVIDYYDDIMMAAIKRIEHREWCVRNAALQLFGGLTPKIVGQKQSGDGDTTINWGEINEVTLNEIKIKLPKTLFYILQYCIDDKIMTVYHSNSTIILFLEFLSNIDYLKFDLKDNDPTPTASNQLISNSNSVLFQYREIFWKFLSHRCEKIRKLAATCLIHFHDFNGEIVILALNLIKIFYLTSNPNFEQGIIFSLIEVVNKIKREKLLLNKYKDYLLILKSSFMDNYKKKKCLYYIRIKLLDLFMLLEFDLKIQFIINFIFEYEVNLENACNYDFISSIKPKRGVDFGYYLWQEKVKNIYNIQ